MTHLVLTEAGIKAFEMPIEPDWEEMHDSGHYRLEFQTQYNQALASAIENGVLLEKSGQSKAIRIIKASNVMETIVLGRIEPNKPYPIPEGWEVVITEKCDSKHYWETAKLIKN
jgi:hypothetical protein